MRIGGGVHPGPERGGRVLGNPGRARCSARRRDARSRAALEDKDLTFNTTTVVENRPASADGVLRTLLLSVDDDVRQLSGRKFGSIPSLERLENPRWIDAFNQPGQYVIARNAEGAKERVVLASTPYDAHKDSAFLSASKVQILVDRNNTGGLNLGNLAPATSSSRARSGRVSSPCSTRRTGSAYLSRRARTSCSWRAAPGSGRSGPSRTGPLCRRMQAMATWSACSTTTSLSSRRRTWTSRAGGGRNPGRASKDASVIEGALRSKGRGQEHDREARHGPELLISGFPGKVTARLSRLLSNNGLAGTGSLRPEGRMPSFWCGVAAGKGLK